MDSADDYEDTRNYSVTRHALAAWLRARDKNTQVVPILPMPKGNRHDVTVQVTEQLQKQQIRSSENVKGNIRG